MKLYSYCTTNYNRYKRYLLAFTLVFIGFTGYSATRTSNGTGDWGTAGTWVENAVPVNGDSVIIKNTHSVTVSSAQACTAVNINTGGTLTVNDDIILSVSSTFTNNGTFTQHRNTITFNGAGGSLAGSSTTVVCNLTINLSSSTGVVSMTSSAATLQYNSGGGTLTLTNGIFKIGASNTLTMTSNGGSNTINNPNTGGSLATTGTNGSDGGTIFLTTGGSNAFNLTGTGQITMYNLQCGSSVGSANRNITQTNTNVKINGTLTLQDNNASWSSNSPAYGSASTLYVNNNGQGYSPGSGSRLEWLAMSSGTIGTTAGYPHNVTIVNMGTSVTNGCGFALSGTWCIDGTLAVGDGTTACAATLENMTAFTSGGITIDNGSTLKHKTETFTVKGNWTQQGTTTGIFSIVSGTTPIIFAGSGTSVSPQTINCTGSSTSLGSGTLDYVKISGGTYVKTNCAISVNTGGAWEISASSLEADYSLTAGTLNASSGGAKIYLNTGNHTVTFASSAGVAWSANYLYIYNWLGGYNGTAAGGSNPKFFIGAGNNTGTDLTNTQLSKVTFVNSSYKDYTSSHLATGEIVPTGTLPVKLVSFTGEKVKNTNELYWITASEINSDYFEVLRSSDGVNFESIGKVNGAGNSVELLNYVFVDYAPLNGMNYYKLAQYDFDGANETFNTIAINHGQNEFKLISLYPNPVSSYITMNFQASTPGMYFLNILDDQGKELYSAIIAGMVGENQFNLSTGSYSSGNYFLRVVSPKNETITNKVVVQH